MTAPADRPDSPTPAELAARISAGDRRPVTPGQPIRAPLLTVPDLIPAGQAGFVQDIGEALAVWRQQPVLPAMSALFGALTALSSSRWVAAPLAALFVFVFYGWVGAERLWYLRAFTGRTLTITDALTASFRYFGRFFRLALLVLIVEIPLSIPLILASVHAANRATQGHQQVRLSIGLLLYTAVLSLLTDFALTFVTPALVFSTDSALNAIGIGQRLLRRTWPHAAGYVLVPPLAVLLVTRLSSGPVGWLGAAVVTISSLLNLLAKGATAAYYLRIMPTAGPDGAVGLAPPPTDRRRFS